MTVSRWIAAFALPFALSACAVASGTDPAPVPVPEEELEEGSAALEEAGLSGEEAGEPGVEEEDVAPLPLEEQPDAPMPGAFLYPADGELPEAIQRQVGEVVHKFTEGRASRTYRVWLEREAVWGDWIRGELRAAGLPEELVYMAMIESGFHPTIVSHAGATGMWQFMKSTARLSGLRVDGWIDERRDPVKATAAAIRHLTELYDATGDWALSAAAYNAGLGRVSRAQARQPADARDYFSLSLAERLPRETRNYVPIMLAAAWVDAHRADYGLPERQAGTPPTADSLSVDGRTRLSVLAQGLGVPFDTLEALNPHLVRAAVPPEGGTVRVPVAIDTAGLAGFLAAVPRNDLLLPDWRETWYTVRSGDSWWRIARRHDTTVDRLRRLNPRRGDVIHPRDRILVRRVASYDRPGDVKVAATRTPPEPEPEPIGESLAGTAVAPDGADTEEGATPSRGTADNGREAADPAESSSPDGPDTSGEERPAASPAPASTPATPASESPASGSPAPESPAPESPATSAGATEYTVRAGDTMTGIARRFGVALDDLARWNDLDAPRPVRIGETLRVAPPVIRYIVQAGDTMTGLARKFDVDVDDLAAWNGMGGPRPLRIGETLMVRRP